MLDIKPAICLNIGMVCLTNVRWPTLVLRGSVVLGALGVTDDPPMQDVF